MASSLAFKPLQQTQLQLLSFTHCKYSSSLNPFKFHLSYPAHSLSADRNGTSFEVCAHATDLETRLSPTDGERILSRKALNNRSSNGNGSVFSSNSLTDKMVNKNHSDSDRNAEVEQSIENRVILKDRYSKSRLNSRSKRQKGPESSYVKSKDENSARSKGKSRGLKGDNGKKEKRSKKVDNNDTAEEKRSRKSKVEGPGNILRVGLDMCSKRGDVMGAIRLYDLASRGGVKMEQYHYAVLLYLCSSAATGVVQPAKSGSAARSLNLVDMASDLPNVGFKDLCDTGQTVSTNHGTNEFFMQVNMNGESCKRKIEGEKQSNVNGNLDEVSGNVKGIDLGVSKSLTKSVSGPVDHFPQTLGSLVQLMKSSADNLSSAKDSGGPQGSFGIQISEDVRRYALQRGFEIYEKLRLENIPMSEAMFTSVARMAMSLGDGDMAFDVVKHMKELGITPRLRSYGPALLVFCRNGDVEKAFLVEEHMLEHGVYPEEPELEALLRVSTGAGRGDKVYYLMHKLRMSVRQVSPSTAEVIEKWFKSSVASKLGKRKWDQRIIMEAMENSGGGWHGQGWLGKGKWFVSHTFVRSDGVCNCCGEKLVTIDLDPTETENFAKSVASLAAQREKNSSFQKFQKWLDYYGPFEAVVDAANVGLYSQRKFRPSKVNAVVNGIRQMLPSKKWPLIILHNRRITGGKMDEPMNKNLIEKWKNADALYATPTGSNDDWYWLYAAIKFKCLLVTNDEMRDHLFQLLGNDFFPKWKERHQVHFSFSETGPVIRMPPPCSVVIQESDKGHWHIPIVSEIESEEERTWLCITRAYPSLSRQGSSSLSEEPNTSQRKKEYLNSGSQMNGEVTETPRKRADQYVGKRVSQEIYQDYKSIPSSNTISDHHTILPELQKAEALGNYVIDFQI